MKQIMDQATHNNIVSFIWGIADDVLRDLFKRGKYPDVILPMCIIRRMDAVLEPTKKAVLDTKKMLNDNDARITAQSAALRDASGQAFYNTSRFTLRDLASRGSEQQLLGRLQDYLDGFSPNVLDILENFKFPETYAICKADMLIKGEGENANHIVGGAEWFTLSHDAFPSKEFDFMLANPPYGKSWKKDLETTGGKDGMRDPRFKVMHKGEELSPVTRSSDGQMLFLVNMASKMNPTPICATRSKCRCWKRAASLPSSGARYCPIRQMPESSKMPQKRATKRASPVISTSHSRCARWRTFAPTSLPSKKRLAGCWMKSSGRM
jgi:type I restriction-modification system DNA methylase subunit